MIYVISRFAVQDEGEDEVRAALEANVQGAGAIPGFLGSAVVQETGAFVLVTRWRDEASFEAWSARRAGCDPFVPSGAQLDPPDAVHIVGAVGGARSGDAADLGVRAVPALADLIEHGRCLHILEISAEGRITDASRAFVAAHGADPVGLALDDVRVDRPAAPGAPSTLEPGPVAWSLRNARGEPWSLVGFVRGRPGGFVLAGEPPWEQQEQLQSALLDMNAQLAVLSRENARQARALSEAHQRLKDAHWRLTKISEVLPICMSCAEVKRPDGTWQDVASFLKEHSDFLSHGYCERCAKALGAEP